VPGHQVQLCFGIFLFIYEIKLSAKEIELEKETPLCGKFYIKMTFSVLPSGSCHPLKGK
jgi:hypothetical protein